MEDALSRFFKFQWGKNKYVTIAILAAFIIGIIVLGVKLKPATSDSSVAWDIYVNLIASLLAFLFAIGMLFLIARIFRKHEDEIKVSYKNSKMLSIYKNNYKEDKKHEYRKKFPLHPIKEGQKKEPQCIVYCNELFLAKDCKALKIEDLPDEHFEVDTFIQMHAPRLLGAHSASKTVNEITPRLNDCVLPTKENNLTATLQITRSTYLNHLLTNRVLDYPIASNVILRDLYEGIGKLTELKRSKMSNHIGINALLFLIDGNVRYLVLPHRGKDATVVKDGVTASIATRLMIEDYEKAKEKAKTDGPSLEEYIASGCIKECIENKIPWDKAQKTERDAVLKNMEICFLGLARDPYEGGKPTLFYTIDLKASLDTFVNFLDKNYVPEGIDAIQDIMIVAWDGISMNVPDNTESEEDSADKEKADIAEAKRYDKAKLELKGAQRIVKGERKDIGIQSFIFEQNLIVNFWFYLIHKGEIEYEKA